MYTMRGTSVNSFKVASFWSADSRINRSTRNRMTDSQAERPLLWVGSGAGHEQDVAIRRHVHGDYRMWKKAKNTRFVAYKQDGRRLKQVQSTTMSRMRRQTQHDTREKFEGQPQDMVSWDPSIAVLTLPSLHCFKGNSDPFNSAAISMLPTTTNLLAMSAEFMFFRARPANGSAEVRRRLGRRHRKHVQAALGSELDLSLLLASGALVRPDTRALHVFYKAKALALFHQKPHKELNAQQVYQWVLLKMLLGSLRQLILKFPTSIGYHANNNASFIRLMITMEEYAGNSQIARLHQRAGVRLIRANDELEQTTLDPIPVLDVSLPSHIKL
jgi:hypothetical protein